MLKLQQIAITRGARTLVTGADLAIFEKHVIGIVGPNGSGKSTLFSTILGELEPAGGRIDISKNIRIQSLKQETAALDISAVDYVISGDEKLFEILQNIKATEAKEDYDRAAHLYHRLSEINGYDAEPRAAKILVGLGFPHEKHQEPVKSFSGGWRMRLNLAKCLFAPSDLLLLDEPTNHLDLEAIVWLETFIQNYPGAILLVSHDRDFLDHTVTHIAHLDHQQLKLYTGNFSAFEIEQANAIALQKQAYKKQQAQISHMMSYVERFRSKASKARQAQSRLKAVEKMDLIAPVYERSPFTFQFKEPKTLPNPMIAMHQVNLGYEENIVLRNLSLSIAGGQRLGLLGINGAGKSTLIKAICGKLDPLKGNIELFPGTAIGYFAQHQVDYLPLEDTPLSLMRDLARDRGEQDLLRYLGSFNFDRDKAMTPLKRYSGGEKARFALAMIIWQRPNLLLLDEPTNHLDLEVRQALIFALQAYKGSLILVSHDSYLLRTLVDELLLIQDGKLNRFEGTVEDYQALYR